MRVGFGGYRISVKSEEHRKALTAALEKGCSLVDTSANYTDGESERLIGEVLKETGAKPLVVTKAGYIQGQNLENLQKLESDKGPIEHVDFSEGLKHSIDPVFLKDQLDRSLERLGLKSVEALLLHNPEYYLKKSPGRTEEYYLKIEKAFAYLQSEVEKGRIKSFGVSSNTFISPREDDEATDLERVWKAAENVQATKGFKYIQFPMNLIEMNALLKQFDGKNLIERAKELGLTTMVNRPLNAFSSSGLLRLAAYPVDEALVSTDPNDLFQEKTKSLYEKWKETRESEDDKLEDIPLFLQIKNIWHQQASADAVQQIFFGHFFPFIARVYGRDLAPEESESFYGLYEAAIEFSKKHMNERAEKFMEQAQTSGLVEEGKGSISQRAVKKYAQTGADYVLVGMRQTDYVDDMKDFF